MCLTVTHIPADDIALFVPCWKMLAEGWQGRLHTWYRGKDIPRSGILLPKWYKPPVWSNDVFYEPDYCKYYPASEERINSGLIHAWTRKQIVPFGRGKCVCAYAIDVIAWGRFSFQSGTDTLVCRALYIPSLDKRQRKPSNPRDILDDPIIKRVLRPVMAV